MDLIKYHYAEAQQILQLDDRTFERLVHQKIYSVNPKFALSQECIHKLVHYIKYMETSRQNLLAIKNMIKFFQAPILYFCHYFYTKSNQNFQECLLKNNDDSDETQKRKQKVVLLLQQIGLIYKRITKDVGTIQYFEFFTKYGVSKKQISFSRTDSNQQNQYLRFLKKVFQQEVKIKDPQLQLKTKIDIIRRLGAQANSIIKDQQCRFLEKITVKQIFQNFQSLIQSSLNLENSVIKNSIQVALLQEEKKIELSPQVLQSVKHISPCCRTFFYQNQPIIIPESFVLQYKNYKFPYDNYCTTNLRKTICGFLNRAGGIILVGILQKQNRYKEVKGQYLSQNKKELVLKEFKRICQNIYPDIISQGKLNVKFVPIKKANNKFLPGKYIVKVQISAGDPRSMYTMTQGRQDYFVVRTANQVLKFSITQQTLKKYKDRLFTPTIYSPIHQIPCPQPEKGQPIFQDKSQNKSLQKRSSFKGKNRQRNSQNRSKSNFKRFRQKKNDQSDSSQSRKYSDFVYFNSNKSPDNIKTSKSDFKFTCDEDDQQIINRKEKRGNAVKQPLIEFQNEQDSKAELDFKPLNPVRQKNNSWKQKKRYSSDAPIIQRVNNVHLQNKPKFVSYVIQKNEAEQQNKARPVNQKNCIDFLVAGMPYNLVKQQVRKCQLSLIQEPIQCNHDQVTWIKLNVCDEYNYHKTDLFVKNLEKRKNELNITKNIKTRKLQKNVLFKEQILLNRLIYKLKHDQEFTDRHGIFYYKCRDKIQAIQAFTVGLELNCKVKFISDFDLQKKRKQQLKFKYESK